MSVVSIKKKCGTCTRIRPIAEFRSTNGSCDHCTTRGQKDGIWSTCLKCNDEFQPVNRFNRICERCKGSDEWSVVMYDYTVEVF